MQLTSISLENIRSYTSVTVHFSSGITLLTGDIGSGKSTLLIAAEFALFGLSRGELSGAALLRHGTDRGRVTLSFIADGCPYTISRTLKSTSQGIVQDAGWLETNGNRESLTATELRARIFTILGYPLQFLGKRNLLYRYTLYTPQEEMKSILALPPETRLETLRRVFGVDSYRTMRDNVHVLMRELKSRQRSHEEVLLTLDHELTSVKKQTDRESELQERYRLLAKERARLREQLVIAEGALQNEEQAFARVQAERQVYEMRRRNKELLVQDITRMRQLKTEQERRLLDLNRSLTGMHERYVAAPLVDDRLIVETEQELAVSQMECGRIEALLSQLSLPEVSAGELCPLCQQQVSANHLQHVQEGLRAKQSAAEKKLARLQDQRTTLAKRVAELRTSVQRHHSMTELKERIAMQEAMEKSLRVDLGQLHETLASKEHDLAQFVDQPTSEHWQHAETRLVDARTQARAASQQVLAIEKSIAALEQEQQSLSVLKARCGILEREIRERKSSKEREAAQAGWLDERFSPFTVAIERHMLSAIHATFSEMFTAWCKKLIEDDELCIRLDYDFAPVIEQHGYETSIEYLSGGERTAVALAYRLALVHTVHSLLPHLGTSGLIMLDEPTDGFSTEQLGRMRDVLLELNMQQVIIVSHEQQLEGFVDHIIRVWRDAESLLVQS